MIEKTEVINENLLQYVKTEDKTVALQNTINNAYKVYSAQDIGKLFGISANKVGRLANQYDLKQPEFGEYRRSKSRYSPYECVTWVYFKTAISEFTKILSRK